MKQKKLTLVIGAGASKELGLPLGWELKSRIASLLDIRFKVSEQVSGDTVITSALRLAARQDGERSGNVNGYLPAAWAIRDAMPQAISIDHFIDSRHDDKKIEQCAKLAIVRCILDSEKYSTIYIDPRRNRGIDYDATDKSWLNPFMRLLTEDCRVSDLDERMESVAFVIFNYDRCVEHYLYFALQNYFKIPEQRASELLRKTSIYHPYGSVGLLPWQENSESVAFGEDLWDQRLIERSKGIRTFTEGTDAASSDISDIRQLVNSSQNILFLGFAFHKLNMQLLSTGNDQQPFPGASRVFATAKGISNFDKDDIASELCRVRGCRREQVNIRNDLTCREIFTEYARGLSLVP